MARVLVESLSGVGAIHAGDDQLLRMVPYELSVWSEDGAVTIDGHISITGIAEAVVLGGPDTVTLTLEDGRRLAFKLTSSSGGIVAGNWLQ